VSSLFTLAPVSGLGWLVLGKAGFVLDSVIGAMGVLWALIAAFGIRTNSRWCAAASTVAWAFAISTVVYLASVIVPALLWVTSDRPQVWVLVVLGMTAAVNVGLLVLWALVIIRTRAIAHPQRLLHGEPEPAPRRPHPRPAAPRRAGPEDEEGLPPWDDR
jgi:hypothetical protein